MDNKVVCVVGPTACGKTKMGVALAQRFGGEVVSVDSMQIYRGMTVGTAAPTAEEMEGVPHHMVAVADPAESWSVARYVREAVEMVRGKAPEHRIILLKSWNEWAEGNYVEPDLKWGRGYLEAIRREVMDE